MNNNSNNINTNINTEINTNLNNYKQFLTNEAYSPKTISTYIYCIEQYYKFLTENNIDTNFLTKDSILQYKQYLLSKDDKASTINQTLSAIRNYNEYLISIGKMDNNLIIKRDFIKTQNNTNPCTLTKETVSKFLNRVLTKETRHRVRNIAIIYFMIFSGTRKAEVYDVKLEDAYDIEMNQQITVIGKGSKERTIVLESEEAIKYINEYLKVRNSDSKYLFVPQGGNHFSESALNKIFAKYCTPKCKIHPHELRHWAATNMLNNGYSIGDVQNQLGHSDLSTTGKYLLTNINDIRKKAKKMKAC